MVFLFIWIRATYPRLRIDQIMAFSWKFLLPLSLINLLAVSLEVFFLRDAAGRLSTGDLGIMAGINIAVTLAAIALFGRLISSRVTFTAGGNRPGQPVNPVLSGIEG